MESAAITEEPKARTRRRRKPAQLELPWTKSCVLPMPSDMDAIADSSASHVSTPDQAIRTPAGLADARAMFDGDHWCPAGVGHEACARERGNDPRSARNHGGRRAGAGRKKKIDRRPRTPHRERAVVETRYPVHVELHVWPEIIQTLRVPEMHRMVKEVIRDQLHPSRIYAEAFRVIEFSLQRHEVQLIVEVTEVIGLTNDAGEPYTPAMALRGGVSGFMIAFAHRYNAMCGRGRRGKVWAARYMRHDLETPTEVLAALRKLFHTAQMRGEHGVLDNGIDLFSTAIVFMNFEEDPILPFVQDEDPDELDAWPVMPPDTSLAYREWRRAGPLYASLDAEAKGAAAPNAEERTERLLRRGPELRLECLRENWLLAIGNPNRPTSRPRDKFIFARAA